MEVNFLDVGQGSANFVLLGDQRALVIDCGPVCKNVLLRALKACHVEYLDRLMLSHSHADHSNGGVALLNEYAGRIGKIGLLCDPALRGSNFFARLKWLIENGRIDRSQIDHLQPSSDGAPYYLHPETGVQVDIYSPDHYQNLLGNQANNPNQTSTVVAVERAGRRVVFGGDSTIDQWRAIYASRGQVDCDIVTVPHHGGDMKDGGDDLAWLYDTAIKSELAIVSVGSANRHKHPREEVISSVRKSGCEVMCTQVTPKCCDDLNTLLPAVIGSLPPSGASTPERTFTGAGKKRRCSNVACAGTIAAEITDEGVEIRGLAAHRRGIERLISSGSEPLCVLAAV